MCVCVCSSSIFGSVSSFYLRFSNFTSIFWYFAFCTESVLFDVSVVRSTLFFWRLLVRSYSIAIAFAFMCEQSYWCRQLFSLSLIPFIYSSENPTRMNRIIIYERLLFEFGFIFGHFFSEIIWCGVDATADAVAAYSCDIFHLRYVLWNALWMCYSPVSAHLVLVKQSTLEMSKLKMEFFICKTNLQMKLSKRNWIKPTVN